MTTYIDYAPIPRSAFQFQPILDGQTYRGVIRWNVFRQDWYLELYTINSVLLISRSLISSPPVEILASTQWNSLRQQVSVECVNPHRVPLGQIARRTLSGFTPDGYNGTFDMAAKSPTVLTFGQSTALANVTATGNIAANTNLVDGLFSSTLVYRDSSKQFEVSP